jgi:hypothetical protein
MASADQPCEAAGHGDDDTGAPFRPLKNLRSPHIETGGQSDVQGQLLNNNFSVT